MTYQVTGGIGTSHSGETSFVFRPTTGVDPARYGVILAHGANGGGQQWVNGNAAVGTSYFYIGPALANAGFTCIASDLGSTGSQDVFGNDTGMARMEEDRAALAALGCKAGKVLLLGVSHGGLMIQNYARANPSRVAAAIGLLPLCDLDVLRDNNTGGFQAQVNTAWGLAAGSTSGTVPLPGRASPAAAANRALIGSSRAPFRFYYSSADSIIPQATVTAQAAGLRATGLGCDAVKVSSSLDHSGNFGPVWPYNDFVQFLTGNMQ